MKTIHRPSAAQSIVLTFTPSDVVTDMTAVTGAMFKLRGPARTPTGSASTMDLSATLNGAAATGSVTYKHVIDPTANEAQKVGYYQVWGVLSVSGGTVNSDPFEFQVVNDWQETP